MYIRQQQLQQRQFSDTELIQQWVALFAPHERRFHWLAAKQFKEFVGKPLAQVTGADIQAFASSLANGMRPFNPAPTLAAVKSLLIFGNRIGVLPGRVIPQRQLTVRPKRVKTKKVLGKRNKIFPLSFAFYFLPFSVVTGLSLTALRFLQPVGVTPLVSAETPPSPVTPTKTASDGEVAVPPVPQVDSAPHVNAQIQAFLDMVAWAEGTAGVDGYRKLFGGTLFSSFEDHPRQVHCATKTGEKPCSTAAGRYQFLEDTWDRLAKKLELTDFSPRSQDLAAIELIVEEGALADIEAGDLVAAIDKMANIWAPLPGSPYNQPKKSIIELEKFYSERLRELKATEETASMRSGTTEN